MPSDRHCLLAGEAYVAADHIDGFLAVTVWERIVDLVAWLLFPLTGLLVFDVTPADAIEIHLANVVKQCDDRSRFSGNAQPVFVLHALALKISHKAVVYVQRMPQKSAFKRIMISRAGGRGEEIAAVFEKVQQLV